MIMIAFWEIVQKLWKYVHIPNDMDLKIPNGMAAAHLDYIHHAKFHQSLKENPFNFVKCVSL